MKVRVFTLRSRGKRSYQSDRQEGVAGDLRMYAQMLGDEMVRVVRLCTRTDRSSQDRELLPPLYSAELVALGEGSLLLRGYQSIEGSSYVQEWRCLIE